MYIFKKKEDKKVYDYIPRIDHQDLLFNKASKDTIAESYLGCYGIYSDTNGLKELYVLIIPEIIIHYMVKNKHKECESNAIKDNTYVVEDLTLTEEEYKDFEYTRFMLDKWEYIGESIEDIVIEKYISEIDPFDDDSDLTKLLKETLSKTIHVVNDEKRKYWLTQLYSRIRRTNTHVEDKNTLYSKMKQLEQLSEGGLELTVKVRNEEGKLITITRPLKI